MFDIGHAINDDLSAADYTAGVLVMLGNTPMCRLHTGPDVIYGNWYIHWYTLLAANRHPICLRWAAYDLSAADYTAGVLVMLGNTLMCRLHTGPDVIYGNWYINWYTLLAANRHAIMFEMGRQMTWEIILQVC